MKVEVGSNVVRFSQIIVGKCFKTSDGCIYMRIKMRDGNKDHAVHLHSGETTLFVNTSVHVTPLNLKAVEDTE